MFKDDVHDNPVIQKEKEIIQLKNDKGAIRFKLENKEIEIRKL